jgi:hypothetical protein
VERTNSRKILEALEPLLFGRVEKYLSELREHGRKAEVVLLVILDGNTNDQTPAQLRWSPLHCVWRVEKLSFASGGFLDLVHWGMIVNRFVVSVDFAIVVVALNTFCESKLRLSFVLVGFYAGRHILFIIIRS